MTHAVKRGIRVSFTSRWGDQTGVVRDVLPCISNGQRHALIDVDHKLEGIQESVPLDQITPIRNINYHFSSGHVDAISQDKCDRRFFVLISNISERTS